MKKASDELQRWVEAKRRCGLSDAHVQMARELGMNPKRLTRRSGAPGLTSAPLAQHIEDLYLSRFKRTVPDPVVPVRQLLREALARERTEARERRRVKRQADMDHAEAARTSLLTLRRLLPGGPGVDNDWASQSQEEVK